MQKEPPEAWKGSGSAREQPIIIQNSAGKTIAIGKGAILRPRSGTFWKEGPQPEPGGEAAFIKVGVFAPVPLVRLYRPPGDYLSDFFEV